MVFSPGFRITDRVEISGLSTTADHPCGWLQICKIQNRTVWVSEKNPVESRSVNAKKKSAQTVLYTRVSVANTSVPLITKIGTREMV